LTVALCTTLTNFPAIAAQTGAFGHRVLERLENIDPQSYFSRKPPVLEQSSTHTGDGTKSLHFVTGTGYGGGYIAKDRLEHPLDLFRTAENGAITFDLLVKNPQDVRDPNAGSKFEFNIGSTDTGKLSAWYIPSAMLEAGEWNHISLRLYGGRASLTGSTVNGKPISTFKEAGVNNGGVDFSRADNYRLAIYVADKPVEGYLANLAAAEFSEVPAAREETLTLSPIDADSHFLAARHASVANQFWPRYEIIPPDIQLEAFFDDDILKWDSGRQWKAEFRNCDHAVFCLSSDQAIRGKKNARIEMQTAGPDASIKLTPPEPIVLNKKFDTVEFWVYGRYHQGTTIAITFQRKDGTFYKWSGGDQTHENVGMLFNSWGFGHAVLPETMEKGARLIAIEIFPKGSISGLFHLDEMRVLDYRDFLARTPPVKEDKVGSIVKLPVSKDGACPRTEEKVRTSASIENGVGKLTYKTDSGDEVTYSYSPRTGTMSDLSTGIAGKRAFLPLDGGLPTFELGGKRYSPGSPEVRAECLYGKKRGNSLEYSWRYTMPEGSAEVKYVFSLKGKTLQIEMSSPSRNVASWSLGHASGLSQPKVVSIPMMTRGPRVLCDQGFFTSCIVDWYKGNFSTLAWDCGPRVKGDEAYYTYDSPSIIYKPKTSGVRWPFKETIYLTTSSNFGDCLASISNPRSPYKDVLKNRLYRLASPMDMERSATSSWIKSSRDMVDTYNKYGMNNLIVMFHGGIWANCGARGPEPFHSRMTTSVATEGGDAAAISLFNHISSLGMHPGYYGGCNFWQPHSITWDYNDTALNPDMSWQPGWVQVYHMKPWHFAQLATTFYPQQAAKFPARSIYEDGWTSGDLWSNNDYDARIPSSGRFIDTLEAVATAFRNERDAVRGPIFSEGNGCCFYTAGLNDGDYGKLPGYASGKTPEQRKPVLLVDFELQKAAPLHAPVSFDLGYQGYQGQGDLTCGDYHNLYQFIATQIAFGTIGSMEPYASIYKDPEWKFDKVLTSYFMMQQLQKRYIMEQVARIGYFDGKKLLSTSDAVRSDAYKDNMLRIAYKNGLVIYVNGNWDGRNWLVKDGDKTYDLPGGGWYATQGDNFSEFSCMMDGRRVDFVDSPDYTYLNAGGKPITLGGMTTDKIAIRHKTGKRAGEILNYPQK